MNIVGMVIFIIFMVAVLVSSVKLALNTRGIVKNVIKVNYPKELKTLGILITIITASFTFAISAIYLWAKLNPKVYEITFAVICSSLFAFSLSSFYVTFRIHYYRKDLDKTLDKVLYRIMIASIPVMIVSLWYSFNGFADYIAYPIANGINIPNGISTPSKSFDDGLTLAFYALCILSGAVFVYFLCDHKMYQQYGKHGTLESTFLVAFPAGIIGARIWYVIGNWNVEFKDQEFWHVFAIWEGGLTILGGAIMGIVVGVLWYIWRNKHYSIWVAVDMIVPTILLAQAIGRLGNFFNCEVHGNPVDMNGWFFLPRIILLNGRYSSTAAELTNGTFYLPLFFIEGLLNVAGYFIISTLFGKLLRRYTELGDLAFGYVLTYGFIRMFLEPLRHTDYNMGEHGYWSWIFSCLFIVFGALGILGNHLVRYLLRKKKGTPRVIKNLRETSRISMIMLAVYSLACIIASIVLMATHQANLEKLTYDLFNVGVMMLIIGIGILIIAGCALIHFFESNNTKTNNEALEATDEQ